MLFRQHGEKGNPVKYRDCPRSGEYRRGPDNALAKAGKLSPRKTYKSEDLPNTSVTIRYRVLPSASWGGIREAGPKRFLSYHPSSDTLAATLVLAT
jgi:hypothetical protein